MYGHKPTNATVLDAWPWVQPIYRFLSEKTIRLVVIDPTNYIADIDRTNNMLKVE